MEYLAQIQVIGRNDSTVEFRCGAIGWLLNTLPVSVSFWNFYKQKVEKIRLV